MGLNTRTISESDAVFLGGKGAAGALATRVDSLRDLAELFHIANVFNQSETPEGLLAAMTDALRERFAPAGALMIRTAGDSAKAAPQRLSGDPECPPEPALEAALQRAAHTGEGALAPRIAGLTPRTILAAPMSAGGQVLGAIAIENAPGSAVYDEEDLQYFMALCRAAAPCLSLVERLAELRREVAHLRTTAPRDGELVGESQAMARARQAIRQAAESHLNILILGESGTGKELAARMSHLLSEQHEGPYVVVNCAAIPAEMLESELFGYKAGAFTGATGHREGLIARAHGGSLFLDEVGDLSPENQARVLRVLETGTYRPLGSDHEVSSQFRVVAATNKNIPELVAGGHFRADLYHRLNGFEIALPPLSEHLEDLPALADHFFQLGMARAKRPLKGFAPEALARMQTASWPGNVRQLRNRIERAIAVARGPHITGDDLGLVDTVGHSEVPITCETLLNAEKRHITGVLRECKGDAVETARRLGLSRSTFYQKIKKHGIDPPASHRG